MMYLQQLFLFSKYRDPRQFWVSAAGCFSISGLNRHRARGLVVMSGKIAGMQYLLKVEGHVMTMDGNLRKSEKPQ